MKRKMFRVVLAVVLALSLSLVMAVPVLANVSEPAVTVDPALQNVAAEYTIVFTTTNTLILGKTITVDFPAGTTVPATGTYSDGDITVQGTNVTGVDVTVATRAVTFMIPLGITGGTEVTVVFTTAAGIENPAAGAVTLTVKTEVETTPVTSATYTILALPTVTAVAPLKGNVDDTMWVEVTGTGFTGTEATNVSTTTLNFGAGITVVSSKFISPVSIDCQITINSAGAVSVAATTAVGTGTTTATFTANAAGTPQVDVWEAYDLITDPFVAGSLAFDQTTTTIQGAEDVCNATETVIVHADTYVQAIGIDQTITLLSLSGADSTIIDGGSSTYVVDVSKKVTIDGFTIKGDATTALQNGIRVRGANVNGFAIQNNKFVDIIKDNIFVTSIDAAITSGLIDDNTFTGLGEDSAPYRAAILVETYSTNAIAGVTISDNTISNYGGVETSGIALAETSTAVMSGMIVSGNEISNTTFGFSLWNDVAAVITDNTFTGGDVGVDIYGDDTAIVAAFTLSENVITDNTDYGIRLHGPGGSDSIDGASMIIKYNDITGNGDGILVDFATVTNEPVAKYNYWGAIGGPSDEGLGLGDSVSADVVYEPWLTEPQATVITDGIRSYGSDAITLEAGWNTLSVPCGLKGTGDTFGDILAMGDYLADYVGGYWYNAATTAWVGIDSATTLEPGKGFYIQMSAASSFPVLYFDGGLHLPAYNMSAGWNLIGSMFGIDRAAGSSSVSEGDYGVCSLDPTGTGTYGEAEDDTTDADIESCKAVNTALASLGANASVVISPSLPGQEATWAVLATNSTTYMIVGEGYWVFMTAPATLAGFEVTPFYFTY